MRGMLTVLNAAPKMRPASEVMCRDLLWAFGAVAAQDGRGGRPGIRCGIARGRRRPRTQGEAGSACARRCPPPGVPTTDVCGGGADGSAANAVAEGARRPGKA